MKRKILAIEDDPVQQKLIRSTLEKNSYDVVTASTGPEGIVTAKTEKPDLILMDVFMPGIDGNQVCRTLKTDLITKEIPIIFITSANSPRDIIEQYDAGGELHLTKPINPKELIEQINITFEQMGLSHE